MDSFFIEPMMTARIEGQQILYDAGVIYAEFWADLMHKWVMGFERTCVHKAVGKFLASQGQGDYDPAV